MPDTISTKNLILLRLSQIQEACDDFKTEVLDEANSQDSTIMELYELILEMNTTNLVLYASDMTLAKEHQFYPVADYKESLVAPN